MDERQKRWQVLPRARESFFTERSEYDRLLLQLLYNRGIKNSEAIKSFLEADKLEPYDPFLFKDMEEAVVLVIKHIKLGNQIYIYGDYDADGITSSALLFSLLRNLNAKVAVYIPDRVTEGYSLNKEAIKNIKNESGKLIITVDMGIRNKEEIEYAKDQGLDVIVTDHHVPPDKSSDLPKSLIINPTVKSSNYPFQYLAGVGVAFKLGQALIQKAKLSEQQKQALTERLLDLVAIGTIADCVTLLGENRILVKKGLKVLNHTKRIGLQELIKVAQINNKTLQAWNVGFQIGPRLNASSRMDHADKAFYLLVSQDIREAKKLAQGLNSQNVTRQKDTETIFDQAIKDQDKSQNKLILAVNDKEAEWSEGIIGLVAGRITEKLYKPTIVITKVKDGYKGSCRSIDEFNILEALKECSQYLDKYGGHPKACGLSLSEDKLPKFKKKIIALANSKLKSTELTPTLKIDTELDLSKIDQEFLAKIETLSPFGQGNPKPQFVSYRVEIRDIFRLGKKGEHIKFRLNNLWAIDFNHKEKWQALKIGDIIDLVYYVDLNEFNGKKEVQLKIVDIRKSS